MDRACLSLRIEPQGDLYLKLIEYATTQCDVALLVVRHSVLLAPLDPEGERVLEQLEPFLKRKAELSEWPGTELLGHTALVHYYNLEPQCVQILKQATDALYSWVQPRLPEDLCFLRSDGEPWLVSIAHERDAYLYLSEEEKLRLLSALPLIASLVDEPSDWKL